MIYLIVNGLMPLQVGLLHKTFPALGACKRFDPQVGPLVQVQTSVQPEAFAADVTLVGLLPRVCSHVAC